jgi:hypothetical protein
MTDTPGTDEMVTCTFDVVAVATFNVRHPGGPTAARAAIDSLQAFSPAHGVGDFGGRQDVRAEFELTCVAPRLRAVLVETDPELPEPGDPDLCDPPLAEPIDGEHRLALHARRIDAAAALVSGSCDARLRALSSLAAAVGAALGSGTPQVRRTCSCGTAWADEPGHDDETAAGSQAAKAAKAWEFIQWAAQNSIVAEDFTQGNEAFNELVRAARMLAAELGITYQPGEGPADDTSTEGDEAGPGNQPGGPAAGGSP